MDIHSFANEEKNGASFRENFEEEIKTAFFYPSDLVNTKTTIPVRVGEERWIYTSTLRVGSSLGCAPGCDAGGREFDRTNTQGL